MTIKLTNSQAVLCLLNDPTPIAYYNIYEEGDIWVKTRGCEDCSTESRKLCCGTCPMLSEKGCFLHLDNSENKPYKCVVNPPPDTCLKWCSLEFKCVQGSHMGKIRRVKDPGDIFHEE